MSLPRRYHRLRAVLDRRQPDLTVLLEDVQVPRNLAAILRSCDAVGVFAAHAVWPGGRLKISRPAVRFYDASRLDPETHARTLFEWVHPAIAAQCRKRGIGYPALGAEGEILGAVPR